MVHFVHKITFKEPLKIDRDDNFVNINLEPVSVVQKVKKEHWINHFPVVSKINFPHSNPVFVPSA